jgi:putative nucleotidyltransferase with HDIG domain
VRVILYRVKQFLWHFYIKLNFNEKEYVLSHLDELEYKIFSKLSIPEQKHSIRVAIQSESMCEDYRGKGINLDKERLIKAALLHDVGKSYKKLNVIDKSLIVILNKTTKGELKRFVRFKKIDTYYNHAEKGANILREYKYDERIIQLVENHHKNISKRESKIQDLELLVLINSDNAN